MIIKRILNKTLRCIGRVLSFVFPYPFAKVITSCYDVAYTGWVSRMMKKVGNRSKIAHGLRLHNAFMISLGDDTYIGRHCAMTTFCDGEITIGDYCNIGQENHLTAATYIKIGNGVQTGKCVLISDNSHGNPADISLLAIPPYERPLHSKGGIVIGDNVWIGENAVILGGVCLGDGSIIGANAVVTHDVPSGAIAVGCPAKIIQRR